MTGFAKAKPAPQQVSQNTTPVQLPSGPSFDVAVRYVMENEDGVRWDHDTGEYTNNPKDPGGRTIWGIIQTEYEAFLGRSLSEDEIKQMPRETALEIYKKNFWQPIHGDCYAYQACATAILDTAVNKGLGGCMVILTDALQTHFESRYGADLIAAVNLLSQKAFLVALEAATERYIQARIEKYPNMSWAQAGWTNRAKRLFSL